MSGSVGGAGGPSAGDRATMDMFTKGMDSSSDAGEESNKITNKVNEQQTEALGDETAAGRPDADTKVAAASGNPSPPPAETSAPGAGPASADADRASRIG